MKGRWDTARVVKTDMPENVVARLEFTTEGVFSAYITAGKAPAVEGIVVGLCGLIRDESIELRDLAMAKYEEMVQEAKGERS